MRFRPTRIQRAWIIEPEPVRDERGFFARLYCRETFLAQGVDLAVSQINTAFNRQRGTLRGMHFQKAPHEEGKLVRCVAGAVFDVIVDLRQESATVGDWVGVTLDARSRLALYVPPGCAHGYVTLTEDTELFYLMGAPQVGPAAHGIRWNDPRLSIAWPIEPVVISERDRTWPDWSG